MLLSKELITKDGHKIYPTFLGPDEREALRDRYGNQREFMWCGCRSDTKLYYRISTDLKIYPEHNGYEHDAACIFSEQNKDRAKKAYIADAETGEVSVFLKFNPENFSTVSKTESFSSGSSSAHEEKIPEEEKYLSLEYFVRDLNTDSYNWRISTGKGPLSADYFAQLLYGRLKVVKFAGKSRSIRDYSLDRDSYSFFYVPYSGITMKSKDAETTSYYMKVPGRDGKIFSWWIYGSLYERTEKRFVNRYGCTPDEAVAAGHKVVAAGFRYRRQKKNSNSTYDCVGKLVLFIVNKNGLFARTLQEKSNLDNILSYIQFDCKNTGISFYIADDDDPFEAYFDVPGKAKALICSDDSRDFSGRAVMFKDIMEDNITKEDVNLLMGRALK